MNTTQVSIDDLINEKYLGHMICRGGQAGLSAVQVCHTFLLYKLFIGKVINKYNKINCKNFIQK